MNRNATAWSLVLLILVSTLSTASMSHARSSRSDVKGVVDGVILPLMKEQNIPGMAVAVSVDGKPYFFNYGVASRETHRRVTSHTLFEIGSVSKTFTATLASYAQVNGNLSLTDDASKYLLSLRGSSFDHISLINLGTHTTGGLPQQVPDNITNTSQVMDWFKHWKPAYAVGAIRTYSNPGIGMLGLVTAVSLRETFEDAIRNELLRALGLTHSYIEVPKRELARYAQGYTSADAPIRMSPGVLDSETYGIKSCSSDLIRYLMLNMGEIKVSANLNRAIIDTHTGYYQCGPMTQDLVWEQYHYPVELQSLLAGNSDAMLSGPDPATRITKPLKPQANVLIDKTGSTNGFGTYVAFVPARKVGIVLLANKSYPIDARVAASFEILSRLVDRLQ